MRTSLLRKSLLGLSALAALAMPSCTNYPKEQAAMRISQPVWMIEHDVDINSYTMMVRERMHERYEDGVIYIEGDGMAWGLRGRGSINPTPVNPVALHLAAHDLSENVAHIARPCQYIDGDVSKKSCDPKLWTEGRYSEEAVDVVNATINEIKARYNLENLHLIGYDGGAAIASILAARRDDVASLRTVAGILDHEEFTNYHNVEPFSNSINPTDYADELALIPQHHFIGGQDEIVPPAILHSYLQALGNSNCAKYTFIQEAEHEAGFVEKWPYLLDLPVTCEGPRRDFNLVPLQDFEPIYSPRPRPVKP